MSDWSDNICKKYEWKYFFFNKPISEIYVIQKKKISPFRLEIWSFCQRILDGIQKRRSDTCFIRLNGTNFHHDFFIFIVIFFFLFSLVRLFQFQMSKDSKGTNKEINGNNIERKNGFSRLLVCTKGGKTLTFDTISSALSIPFDKMVGFRIVNIYFCISQPAPAEPTTVIYSVYSCSMFSHRRMDIYVFGFSFEIQTE